MSNLSVVLSALAHLPSVTEAHGFMGFPVSRHAHLWSQRKDFEPESGIWRSGDSDTSCGRYKKQGPVVSTIPGGTFDLKIYFTANHGGNHHVNFKCEEPNRPWEWLTRADKKGFNPSYPHEFFCPMRGQTTKTTFTLGSKSKSASVAVSKWNSPSQCKRGILRWSWETSNSCISNRFNERGQQPVMTATEFKKMIKTGPGVCGKSSSMERYINCADVTVGGGGIRGGRPPAQAPKPQAPVQTPQAPVQTPQAPVQTPMKTPMEKPMPPASSGNSDPPQCPGWKNSCASPGVTEQCPITCGGRRLDVDVDEDEFVSINPAYANTALRYQS